MTIPTIFETCRPRADVLRGAITEADFAADLAQVIVGKGNEEYLDPGRFFANTYPTRAAHRRFAQGASQSPGGLVRGPDRYGEDESRSRHGASPPKDARSCALTAAACRAPAGNC